MKHRITLVLLAGVVAGLSGSLLVTPADGAPGPHSALDQIPGLGISLQAQSRDDAIALWEAWQRDRATSTCMRRAGFSWEPEALYPEEGILQAGRALGMSSAVGAVKQPSPSARNHASLRVLSPLQQAFYVEALTGEASATIAAADESGGELPINVDPQSFARGGCRGAGDQHSVWDLKRALGPELLSLKQNALRSGAFATQIAAYTSCAAGLGLTGVTSPAQLDALKGTSDEKIAGDASRICDATWRTVNDQALAFVEADFLKRHVAAIDAQQSRYASAAEAIKADPDFKQFLSSELTRVSAG